MTGFQHTLPSDYGRASARPTLGAGHITKRRWPADVHFRFPAPNLRGRLVNRHQTSKFVRRWPKFIKFRHKLDGSFPQKFGAPKHQNLGQISHSFATWSRISAERNISRNGKRHCELQSLLRMPTLVVCKWRSVLARGQSQSSRSKRSYWKSSTCNSSAMV